MTKTPRLDDVRPDLASVLERSRIHTPPRFAVADIRCETVMVAMRDGTKLATDLYLPPELPAPAVAMRTPYGRDADNYAGMFLTLARRGYVVISQDCRGTGGSEPDVWDYYMYEPEDSYDFVEWVSGQDWFGGFLGSTGGSYVGQVQWQMARHPAMSAIVPEVSGLGIAVNHAHWHMFCNSYARSVGKGADKLPVSRFELERHMLDETLSTGYFNEPLDVALPERVAARFPELGDLDPEKARAWLWEHYCSLSCAGRAEFVRDVTGADNVTILEVESLPAVFGHRISHDRHTLPTTDPAELAGRFHAPVMIRTGWYDWGINDALATWDLLMNSAPERVRSRSRLFIAPSAHNMPGYHEGMSDHPELQHNHGPLTNTELLMRWYQTVRDDTVDQWPRVIYYLMGANEWRVADAWPVPDTRTVPLYLGAGGMLSTSAPGQPEEPDRYTYDPQDPTPTVGGSIVSYVYPPGSADISAVQERPDVLGYTTEPLAEDLDVVGPLRLVLYAASSAVDTDFIGRISDVFPDGRAIQLQNGVVRARYRDGEPALLEPGRTYCFEIDLWATANRFKAGHRIRVDICSADFPRLDRNTNRGGEPGDPVKAEQTIHHDPDRPSHLLLPVVAGSL
jgi:uncharacterized protein